MQLLRSSIHNFKTIVSASVVTIGNYDGVHLGHREIFARLTAKAKELSLPSIVVIFEPQPEEFFSGKNAQPRLSSLREKLLLVANHGVDYVLCLRFDAHLSQLSAHDFISKVLISQLNTKYLIVGDDFVFGRHREGNFNFLSQYAKNGQFQVTQMRSHKIGGVRVSSSLIRTALQHGNLFEAERFLGRKYSILGRVVHGDKRGRVLGFPTANVYSPHKVLPISGVYLVNVKCGNQLNIHGVANIGFRPTIGNSKKNQLEVYLLDFSGNIYGEKIEVLFLQKIRDEKKFNSFDDLQKQIADDVLLAKKFFESIPKEMHGK